RRLQVQQPQRQERVRLRRELRRLMSASEPMMRFDFSRSHFDLFAQPEMFTIDRAALDARYRELQAQYHPDRYASGSDAEKRLALQVATHINEAYQTLKSPLSRARYLLQLA